MKANRIFVFVLLIVILFFYIGCKTMETPGCCIISPPEISMTSNKTVIERQIVGDYKELEKNAWVISSVKTNIQKSKGASGVSGDRVLFLAMKIREFHTEKIREYKDEGALGEGNTGVIVYRLMSKYEKDKIKNKMLQQLIIEENKARKTIFVRSLKKSGIMKPTGKDINSFGALFAEEQRALARKMDWIQEKTGAWNRKK